MVDDSTPVKTCKTHGCGKQRKQHILNNSLQNKENLVRFLHIGKSKKKQEENTTQHRRGKE